VYYGNIFIGIGSEVNGVNPVFRDEKHCILKPTDLYSILKKFPLSLFFACLTTGNGYQHRQETGASAGVKSVPLTKGE
jgi:hypothetical protein